MKDFLNTFAVFLVILITLAMCSGNTKASRPDISNFVEVELIIAVDTSGSITTDEYNLQKDGILSAFRSAEFEAFLQRNKYGIAVTYMEWAADMEQQYTKWHRINTMRDVELFLYDVSNMNRVFNGTTAIYAAMLKSLDLFESNPYPGIRKVVDISGDGKNSVFGIYRKADLIESRDKLVSRGITINGLPIMVDTPANDLEIYFNENVIGGSGAFSLRANTFEEYGMVFLRKLLTEIG